MPVYGLVTLGAASPSYSRALTSLHPCVSSLSSASSLPELKPLSSPKTYTYPRTPSSSSSASGGCSACETLNRMAFSQQTSVCYRRLDNLSYVTAKRRTEIEDDIPLTSSNLSRALLFEKTLLNGNSSASFYIGYLICTNSSIRENFFNVTATFYVLTFFSDRYCTSVTSKLQL
ncbi:hypothetical protein KQX54_019889 [Cotesia glomerata]|uniref:Uncharacterized protein n=1 Tax=Cotesia glomerata TaxID=32391 RepID=A0AAV7IGM9_COTGL|nr:hypothetical protein KQX54_019889 [Cotesia glomerata]